MRELSKGTPVFSAMLVRALSERSKLLLFGRTWFAADALMQRLALAKLALAALVAIATSVWCAANHCFGAFA